MAFRSELTIGEEQLGTKAEGMDNHVGLVAIELGVAFDACAGDGDAPWGAAALFA